MRFAAFINRQIIDRRLLPYKGVLENLERCVLCKSYKTVEKLFDVCKNSKSILLNFIFRKSIKLITSRRPCFEEVMFLIKFCEGFCV